MQGGIELHPICPVHDAFPLAFPAVDGSLFYSLPVVLPLDKYIVTGGMWVADSADFKMIDLDKYKFV